MGPVRISPSPPPTNIDRKLNARGCGGVGASCRVRIDPGYIGWREWPADVPVYIAGRQRPTRSGMRTCSLRALRPLSSMLIASFTSASRAGDPVGFAVEKLDARVASPAFWTAAIAYLSQEHAKVERVVSANVSFFKSVFRHYGFAALTAMKEPFERVCKATTERSSQRAAAEIVAGLLRGSKLWCVFPSATLHPPSSHLFIRLALTHMRALFLDRSSGPQRSWTHWRRTFAPSCSRSWTTRRRTPSPTGSRP